MSVNNLEMQRKNNCFFFVFSKACSSVYGYEKLQVKDSIHILYFLFFRCYLQEIYQNIFIFRRSKTRNNSTMVYRKGIHIIMYSQKFLYNMLYFKKEYYILVDAFCNFKGKYFFSHLKQLLQNLQQLTLFLAHFLKYNTSKK